MTFAFQFCSRISLRLTVASPMLVKPPAAAGTPVISDGKQKNDVTMRDQSNIPIPRRYTACRSEQAVRERALSLPIGGSFTVAVEPSSPPARDIAIQLAAWARSHGMVLRYRHIDDRSVRIWRCAPRETVEARQL